MRSGWATVNRPAGSAAPPGSPYLRGLGRLAIASLAVLEPAVRFRSELLRTADRLRGLGAPRLTRTGDGGEASLVDRSFALAERIVAATSSARNVDPPALPRLEPHGCGDQLAVVGVELADLAETGEVPDAVLEELSSQLLELRRST